MAGSPDPQLRRRWQQLLDAFDPDRFTVAAFCRKHGVSVAAFYQWRRKLKRPSPSPVPAPPMGFLPVQVQQPRTATGDRLVGIHLPDGSRIDIPAAERELILAAITALALHPAEDRR